ncbi:hypothetical protein P3T73_03955 [Kiritimatiellota bacterium B12222]|nr:hypothetical protein P3T73_03955 [Kiritimatiellota bacterium B12222]
MNHYINLLEPTEVHYHNAAANNPLYKIGGIVVAVLVVAFFGLKYKGLQDTIKEGNRIESTWKKIEADVEAAKVRSSQNQRFEEARKTLEGWSASNIQWPKVMDFLVYEVPVSLQDIQFTHLYFDEEMVGLRNQKEGDKKVYPLKRKVNLVLRGIIQSARAEKMLIEYQKNLTSSEKAPVEISVVKFDNYQALRDENGERIDQASFDFLIELKEREVLP